MCLACPKGIQFFSSKVLQFLMVKILLYIIICVLLLYIKVIRFRLSSGEIAPIVPTRTAKYA